MPARDAAKTHEHWLSRAMARFFYTAIAVPLLYVACKIWYGFDIERTGPTRPSRLEGGAVVVANHVQYLDCALVAFGVYPRFSRFVVLDSNFEMPVVGRILKMTGCVAAGSDLSGHRRMSRIVNAELSRGGTVGIYPEGDLECYRDGLAEFHTGTFNIAVSNGVSVIPVTLRKKSPMGIQALRRKPSYTVVVGEPMKAMPAEEQMADGSVVKRTTHERSTELMERVRESMLSELGM